MPPTASVRNSYLEGERAAYADDGLDDSALDIAERDFEGFVSQRRSSRQQWGVPVTELWFVEGTTYIGTAIIRHRLTPALLEDGGHIGFHVVPGQRRKGYAKQMLGEALRFCRHLGLEEVLITCDVRNVASQRVIEANGGRLERIKNNVRSYRVALPASDPGDGLAPPPAGES